jgi:hypothetical protein
MLGDGDWVEGEPKGGGSTYSRWKLSFGAAFCDGRTRSPSHGKDLAARSWKGWLWCTAPPGSAIPRSGGQLYREGVTKVLAAAQALANAKEVGASC